MCAAETKAGGGRDNIFRVKARAEAKARHEAEELVANGEAPLVGEVFHDSDDEQDATDLANLAAPDIVDQLREQFGEIRHWVYPCGVVCITSAVDHEAGLGLDASAEATNAFTVLRGWGDAQAPYDVVMFKRQPRTTLVGFPHDAQAPDDAVGLRARALLLRDVAWCERDDLESSSGDEFDSVPPPPSADDGLRIRALDVGSSSDCQGAIVEAGQVDILINNAGASMGLIRDDHLDRLVNLDEVTPELWDHFVATNLSGPWYLTKACGPVGGAGSSTSLPVSLPCCAPCSIHTVHPRRAWRPCLPAMPVSLPRTASPSMLWCRAAPRIRRWSRRLPR